MSSVTPERFSPARPVVLTIPTPDYRSQSIPGVPNGKLGDCYVRVVDLPTELDLFMEVNPRVPNRTKQGVLSGPVVKGIHETLTEAPDNMALMNQGIFLLVEDAGFMRAPGGVGELKITLTDKERHGIVNGGHTFAAIRQAIEDADENEAEQLDRAWVRLHILHGIDAGKVGKIAEGLNRSKQVDDPSLDNLDGIFNGIKEAMKGKLGENEIAYFQGDPGDLYISDVLVLLQFFNCERYSDDKHPHTLYRKPRLAADAFKADLEREQKGEPAATQLLVPHVHEILALADEIRSRTPQTAKDSGYDYGRMKAKPKAKKAMGSAKEAKIELPFIGKKMKHTVPKGWVAPMLAAFRANVDWNLESGKFEWRVPVKELLDGVISDLVNVCVTEHRDNKNPPEMVGNRESSYRQCYDKVLLYLARRGKLVTVKN